MGRVTHRVYSDLAFAVEYFEHHGMEARFWQDEADRFLHVLVRPDIGKVRGREILLHTDVTIEPSLWFGHWWAKLLRRYDSWVRRTMPYKLERILRLPHWLTELAWAKFVRYSWRQEQLPDDMLERIQAMRHYLMRQNHRPTRIIVGRKGLPPQLAGYVEYYPDTTEDRVMEGCILGLSVQTNPFIGDDEILVV